MTLEVPYSTIKDDDKAKQTILNYGLPSVRDGIAEANHKLSTICRACWHPDPESRPTMELILKSFRDWTLNAVCAVALCLHIAN